MTSIAHPVAGRQGEGPPVAPPHWKWRCGNRMSDMYFYNPAGQVFRSRTKLTSYLSTLPGAPSADEFCWKVTPEILEGGAWSKPDKTPDKKPPRSRNAKSKAKDGDADVDQSKKKPKQSDAPCNETQVPSPGYLVLKPLAIRAPGSVMTKKVTSLTSRTKVKAKKNRFTVSRSFKEILAEASSFTWLYDSNTQQSFLEEAGKLNDLSAAEVRELRNLLVARTLQVGNFAKYSNPVLRVFVRLLGTGGLREEPSHKLGKVELVEMCLNLAKGA